jgi:hypothetical protein
MILTYLSWWGVLVTPSEGKKIMSAPPTRPEASLTDPLRGRRLLLARLAWIVVAMLAVGLFIVGIPDEFALLHTPCPAVTCPTGQLSPSGLQALEGLGLSLDSFAVYTVAMDIIFAAVCTAVSLLIFWRRSDDRMGLLVSLALLTFGTATFVFTMEALAARHPEWGTPTFFLHFVGAASFSLFLYLFPDGRFVPRWTRWVVLVWIAWQMPRYFYPNWYLNPNPYTWHALINTVVWLVALGTAIFSQGYRFRRTASSAQRQQIKWVVFGISAALTGFLGIFVLLGVFAPAPTSPGTLLAYLVGNTFLGYLAILLIPISIGFAVLRYHLFDIDLIINRTLVYVTLTVILAAFYEGTIVVLQHFFRVLTGQESQVAVVASTLVIAAAFEPLRRRIQALVDRSFYRRKYDAAKTLEAFSAKLKNETDLDALREDVVGVARRTMQPAHVSLWLRPDPETEARSPALEQFRHEKR